MKKQLSVCCIILAAVILGMSSCKKTQSNESIENKTKSSVSPDNPKPTCVVPIGYTTCEADCLFSTCCIVWDPAVQTGGCACYWGFSSCKSEVIKRANVSRVQNLGIEVRTIRIKTVAIEQFFVFCYERDIDISVIEQHFNTKLRVAGIHIGNNMMQVDETAYDTFLDAYKIFINTLTEDKVNLIKNYIAS